MKKFILIEILFLNKKDSILVKKIRFNTSKENFDADYEASRIQTFISQFKDNKIKEIDSKNKELENKFKKLELQLANVGVRNNDFNDKK